MSEYNEGDLVKAVKGEESVRARLHHGTSPHSRDYLYLGHTSDLSWYESSGWTVTVIEKAAPPLPTEPGLYLSSKPDGIWVFSLDRAGDWTLLNTNSLFPIGDGHLEGNAPFTRLEPVPTTAKRVLDDVIARTTMHCNACAGRLAEIREEYGAAL